ncbi:MAG TPA: PspC domain-containing protein [Candidatus Limnocylindrales bacterium]|nr:PspC domain-containing protein [Candidatus Limnocylindrales bacterium]
MTAGSAAPYTPQGTPEQVVRRLHRSRTNRVLAGICGGIAEYYGSDPTAVRLAAIVLGVFTGIVPMVVAYIVAAIVIPEASDGPVGGPSPGVAPGQTSLVLGALLVIVGVLALANVWLHIDWDQVWPLALIGLGAVVLFATIRARP